MKFRYKTDEEIARLVENFETGRIERADWRHAEHLTVALYYARRHDLPTATRKMRDGIFNLLRSFNVNLSAEMPYHETLTVFWMRTIFVFALAKNGAPLGEIAGELIKKFDPDYPLRFYSRELLFSPEARREYLVPDRQPL